MFSRAMEVRSGLFSRAVAIGAGLLLLSSNMAGASVVQGRQGLGNPGNVWITVDSSGSAQTITPTPTTVNGAVSTISGPPEYVTKTSVYTLTKSSSVVTTSTGKAPVASATGTGEAGAFLQCSNYQGVDSPFCLPQAGSVLAAGRTYYVTWDSSIFANENQTVQVQGEYADGEGFSSADMLATAGFYAWTIDRNFLTEQNTKSLVVSLRLAYYESDDDLNDGNLQMKVGPNITVSGVADTSSGGSHSNTLAIAIPVVLGVVAILIVGFCVWSWRRHGHVLGFGKRRSQGYGERQSRSQRTGAVDTAGATGTTDKGRGIQLTDRESWSPTQGGRNVFREEIQRQEQSGV